MTNVLLKTLTIFIVMAFGFAARRRGVVDAAFNRMLSALLLNVFYPALIFSSLTNRFSLSGLAENILLPAGSFMILLCGWAIGAVILRFYRFKNEVTGRLFHFQCALNNYSFLPLMLAAALMGGEAMALVVYSTLGAEIFVWTFGIQAIVGGPFRLGALRKLVSMPMIAMAAAFAAIAARAALRSCAAVDRAAGLLPVWQMFMDALALTGQATIPVSAVIAGIRMAGLHPRRILTPAIGAVTFLRLVLIPAAALLSLRLLPLSPDGAEALALVAVMPCALASVTLAEVYGGDADFAAGSVMTTHALCVITIPLWLRLLGMA